MMRPKYLQILILAAGASLCAASAQPLVLETCDASDAWSVTRQPATVGAAEDAIQGGAIHVTLPGMVSRTLTRSYVPGSEAWDRYAGVSFWVKGDGSEQFGCLALQGAYPFVTYFPLRDTSWHKVTRHWSEFIPEIQVAPLGAPGSMPPSGISTLRIGSRWTITHNNAPIPQMSFALDQIQLEEHIPGPAAIPQPRPFAEVMADLKDGKAVRIQCMGDSITAGTSLPNRDEQRYAVLLQEFLRSRLGRDTITCCSRAVGGAKLTDARAWIPRDFQAPRPDLVTMWYGYNDKSNAHTADYFEASLNDYIDRVCRVTDGQAAILLIATGPGTGPRFVMLDDYAERVRRTAARRGLPCFDVHAMLKAVGREHIQELFADMAHPNAAGHQRIAEALGAFLLDAAGVPSQAPAP